jgi:hypothetical protein
MCAKVIGTALAARDAGDRPLYSVGKYQGVRVIGVAEALELIAAR